MCFYKSWQNKRVCVLIYYIGKGYFLTGQSKKGYQFQNVEHTVYGKFAVLCSCIGTRLTSKRPPPPRGSKNNRLP